MVGDVIEIEAGVAVPADCLIISSEQFHCVTHDGADRELNQVNSANLLQNPDPFVYRGYLCS